MGRKRTGNDDDPTRQYSDPQFDLTGPFMDSWLTYFPSQEHLEGEILESRDNTSCKKLKTQDPKPDPDLGLPDKPRDVPTPTTKQPQPTPVIQDVFKETSQQDQMLQMTWSQVFRDSESHELFWPTRLDRVLQEAKTLEENLLQQKEVLRSRLQVLSQTLQLV